VRALRPSRASKVASKVRVVTTTLYAYAVAVPTRDCLLLVIPSCPHCQKKHTHGGGPPGGDPTSYFSRRVSHCVDVDGIYVLTPNPELQGQQVVEI